jgi:hypothetical protein
MLCDFETVELKHHRCRRCGLEIRTAESPKRIHARCRGSSRKPFAKASIVKPSLAMRAFNFTVAAIAHVARGAPSCTQQQIDTRLAICRACPLFDGSICRHADCGCRIGQQRKFLNKLAWADQSCPLGKWAAISADENTA